ARRSMRKGIQTKGGNGYASGRPPSGPRRLCAENPDRGGAPQRRAPHGRAGDAEALTLNACRDYTPRVDTVTLGTATPGGGFPVYGQAVAETIAATDPTLIVTTQNTKGST